MDKLLTLQLSESTVKSTLDRLGRDPYFDPETDLKPSQLEIFAEMNRALTDAT